MQDENDLTVVDPGMIEAKPRTSKHQVHRVETNRSWRERQKHRDEMLHMNAGERPIVREILMRGPCLKRGVLLRETSKFYVYAIDADVKVADLDELTQKRILKSKVHIEPCNSCTDHPETKYPKAFVD